MRRNQSIILGGKTGRGAEELFAVGICTLKASAWAINERDGKYSSTALLHEQGQDRVVWDKILKGCAFNAE